MSQLLTYTGGDLATNAYFLETPDGFVCFDAPEGVATEIQRRGLKIAALVLTHGHFDHIWDAARLAAEHQCPVYAHPGDAIMMDDPQVFKLHISIGDIPPVRNRTDIIIPDKGESWLTVAGLLPLRVFHIPGHSRGSAVFYDESQGIVIGGDVLFNGGVGRWDLPGGSRDCLLAGIRQHLLVLPDHTKVYPGHGPPTTIGFERETNPYLEGE